jgi:elongation factor Ts
MISLRSPRHVPWVTGYAFRSFSSSSPSFTKVNIKLVAELRKRTEVSLSKAKEALTATNSDIDAALEWLEKDLIASGAKKKEKVQDRTAGEGLIGVSILSNRFSKQTAGRGGVRAAMVELNCETDFVARNQLFGELLDDIAHTAAFISDFDSYHTIPDSKAFLDKHLLQAPLLSARDPSRKPTTDIGGAVDALIAKVGEKISLSRAVSVSHPLPSPQSNVALHIASYLHGSVAGGFTSQGRIGALALLALKSPRLSAITRDSNFSEDIDRLQRALARQIVGFETLSVKDSGETALYNQTFMMFAGSDQPVGTVLKQWAAEKGLTKPGEQGSGLEVLEFAKWSVGDGGVISSEKSD